MNHICISVTDDCINPDSYGEICVHCNCCGRIDKKTQKQAQLKLYKEQLNERESFDGWIPEFRETQEKNVKKDIAYFKAKIKELEDEE